MRTYYKLIECGWPFEGGEVVGRVNAIDIRQAKRRFGVNDNNSHLCWIVVESKLPGNISDPRQLAPRHHIVIPRN